MNEDLILQGGLLLDAVGVIGLGLLGFAAIRLTRRERSWGGNMMAGGAIALLLARVYLILSPHLVTREFLVDLGPWLTSMQFALPAILLSLGLAGVVWGLWGHSRWIHEER